MDFIEGSKYNVLSGAGPEGGFIRRMWISTANFKDCSFVGSFQKKHDHDDPWHRTAGFIGAVDNSTQTFENCLSCITFTEGSKVEDNRTGYFIGYERDNESLIVKNAIATRRAALATK